MASHLLRQIAECCVGFLVSHGYKCCCVLLILPILNSVYLILFMEYMWPLNPVQIINRSCHLLAFLYLGLISCPPLALYEASLIHSWELQPRSAKKPQKPQPAWLNSCYVPPRPRPPPVSQTPLTNILSSHWLYFWLLNMRQRARIFYFFVWLILFIIIFSTSIHFSASLLTLFLLMAE